jgi:hypothetical protein
MKMFLLVYDVDFDEEVMQTLSTCCVAGYTKWDRVMGKGERSDPKLDNAVWPGFNCTVMMGIEEELEQSVFEALRDLHKNMGGKALKVFSWPLEKVI